MEGLDDESHFVCAGCGAQKKAADDFEKLILVRAVNGVTMQHVFCSHLCLDAWSNRLKVESGPENLETEVEESYTPSIEEADPEQASRAFGWETITLPEQGYVRDEQTSTPYMPLMAVYGYEAKEERPLVEAPRLHMMSDMEEVWYFHPYRFEKRWAELFDLINYMPDPEQVRFVVRLKKTRIIKDIDEDI